MYQVDGRGVLCRLQRVHKDDESSTTTVGIHCRIRNEPDVGAVTCRSSLVSQPLPQEGREGLALETSADHALLRACFRVDCSSFGMGRT